MMRNSDIIIAFLEVKLGQRIMANIPTDNVDDNICLNPYVVGSWNILSQLIWVQTRSVFTLENTSLNEREDLCII